MVILKEVKCTDSGLIGITKDLKEVRLSPPKLEVIVVEEARFSDRGQKFHQFIQRASTSQKCGFQYRRSSCGDGYIIAAMRYRIERD